MKFKYCDYYNPSSASSSANPLYCWRGNSCYDPDLTGAGHQPYLWDQWTNFFQWYLVLGSKIIIRAVSQLNQQQSLTLMPETSTTASEVNWGELPNQITRVLGGNNTGVATNVITLKQYMSSKKMFGHRMTHIEDAYAATNANPVSNWTWYWLLCAQNLQAQANIAICMEVKIIYYVKFVRELYQTQS